nr:homeobox protein 2-like [Dermacentor andersoni]
MIGLCERFWKIQGLNHTVYADDITIWCSVGSDELIESVLQEAVETAESYLDNTGLKWSSAKLELLFYSPRRQGKRPKGWKPPTDRSITIRTQDGRPIPRVDSIRVQGMIIERPRVLKPGMLGVLPVLAADSVTLLPGTDHTQHHNRRRNHYKHGDEHHNPHNNHHDNNHYNYHNNHNNLHYNHHHNNHHHNYYNHHYYNHHNNLHHNYYNHHNNHHYYNHHYNNYYNYYNNHHNNHHNHHNNHHNNHYNNHHNNHYNNHHNNHHNYYDNNDNYPNTHADRNNRTYGQNNEGPESEAGVPASLHGQHPLPAVDGASQRRSVRFHLLRLAVQRRREPFDGTTECRREPLRAKCHSAQRNGIRPVLRLRVSETCRRRKIRDISRRHARNLSTIYPCGLIEYS